MGINYTSRYGLEFNPFIKNTKDILIETEEYKELVFRLNYLLQVKGFGLVTGGAWSRQDNIYQKMDRNVKQCSI